MIFWAPESYPLLASPFQGAGPAGGLGEIVCEPLNQLLPLQGGGWVGVLAGLEVIPLFTSSSAEERIPLTQTFLLNAKLSAPLPQGARGGWSR